MNTRPPRQVSPLSLLFCAGLAASLAVAPTATGAQNQPTDAQPAEAVPENAEAVAEPTIRFTFKDAPIDQVVDFFAKEAGIPVIAETDVPAGAVTFISGRVYPLDEALRVLNTILRTRGLLLRRDAEFLYLGKVGDMQKAPVDTFRGELPDSVTDEQIVSVVIPLNNAIAGTLAENLKGLVASYGSLVAIPNQNMLVLTESAGQVRRLRTIINSLDENAPFEETVEVFPIEHVKASAALDSLRVLVAEKQVTVVFDQQGNRRVVQDENVTGVRIEADDRTNSIIVVGTESRVRTIGQLVEVLDVPDAAGARREMVTYTLSSVDPEQAKRHLEQLYQKLPNDEKPTILPLGDLGKLTLIGSIGVISEATTLLEELDGPLAPSLNGARATNPDAAGIVRSRVLTLANTDPAGVTNALNQLLNPRQQRALRYTALPGRNALMLVGPAHDVQTASELIETIDAAPGADRELRIIALERGLTLPILERAIDLATQADPTLGAIDVIDRQTQPDDGDVPTVSLIAPRAALAALDRTIRELQNADRPPRQTRTYTLDAGEPTAVARRLSNLARPMLTPDDGADYEPPQFDPVDELDTLVVRARADQFPVIEQLLAVVDEEAPAGTEFRVVRLRTSEPLQTAERALALFEELGQNLEPDQRGTVSFSFDEQTGNLLITADAVGMRRFTELLNQAQQLTPPQRTTRLVDLREAQAAEVLAELRQLLADSPTVDPGRRVPVPEFAVVEKTNSILVTAEELQHRVIQDYVRRLDVFEPTELPPLRLLQVRTADAAAIARMLSDQYDKRPQVERREKPVDIRADAATNTLIVSAHQSVLPDVEAFVQQLNTADADNAERETQIFPLKVARATDLAGAMQKLYPEPPMPLDRRGRPMPWLREPREVNVSADPASNSLIVDAPAERMAAFTALVDKLDRVELPPQATLRTYNIDRADLSAITRTLSNLASSGSLNAPAQPGKQRVPVTIESESLSGTLIVGGDDVTHEIVERLLEDLSMVPVERQLRVVRVENADPRVVADRAQEVYQQQIVEIPGAQPVDVSVDQSTNALLVVAEAEAMGRFMRILDQLEEQAGPPRQLRLYELQHAQAQAVIDFLNDLIDSSSPFATGSVVDPSFEPIERSNSILVAALDDQHAILESLIRSVDVPEGAEAAPLRILRLRTAEADNIERVLTQAFAQRPPEERAAKPVSIRADVATNTLIVSAHPEVLPEIETIVSDLNDAQSFDAEGREIRIFPLKVARAEELARTIDQMFPEPPVPVDRRGRPMPQLRQPKEVQVRADAQTNSLIVDAPAKRLAGFEQLVTQLDRAEITGDAELRTYPITRADLDAVRSTLQRLAQSGGLTTGMPTNRLPIVIETEPLTSTLIVSAPTQAFVRIDSIVSELEGGATGATSQLLFFTLDSARADRLEALVSRLLRSRYDALAAQGELPAGRAQQLVEVTAEPATNTLVVSAPGPLAETAREIVARLDAGQTRVGRDVVRVVKLDFADPNDAAPALQRTLDAADLPSGGSVTIAASQGSDALLVSGAEADVAFVEELIVDLDEPPAEETLAVRTIFLEHNRAETVAGVVERVLMGERMNEWIRWQMRLRDVETEKREEVRVAAEPSANAVVITAPKQLIPVAEELVLQLDQPASSREGRRPVRIFALENADAQSVASNLEAVFAEDETLSNEAAPTIRTDADANALIVRATDAQLAEVEDLVSRLDAAAMAGSRQLRALEVDRSRTDAAALAEALRRLLTERGVPVEVITTDELLEREDGAESLGSRSDAGRGAHAAPNGADSSVATAGGSPRAAGGILLPKHIRFILRGFHQTVIAQANDATEAEAADADAGDDEAPVADAVSPPLDLDELVAEARAMLEAERAVERVAGQPSDPAERDAKEQSSAADETDGAASGVATDRALAGDTADGSVNDESSRAEERAPGVTLAVDPETNRLVVLGSSRATERVAALARELQDQLPAEPTTIRVVKLPDQANPNVVSNLVRATLRQLGRASAENPSGMTGRVVVLPDRDSGSLVVAANDTDFETVSALVAALSTPGELARLTIRAFPLTTVRADQAARAVNDLLSTDPRGRQARLVRDGQPLRLTVETDAGETETVEIDAGAVKVTPGPANASLIVAGPAEAFPAIANFIELLDQSPSATTGLTRVYELDNADAVGLSRTLARVFNANRRRNNNQTAPATILSDDRTNTLIVTASDDEHAELDRLLGELDRSLEDEAAPVVVIPVQAGVPSALARAIDDVVIGRDQAKREDVTVRADDALNVLIVRAPENDLAAIRGLLAELDRPDVAELPVRSVKLERADATVVAAALERFFQERARASTNPGQRPKQPRVAISGDRNSGTLLIAASDADFEQITELVATFDAPGGAADLQFNVIQLENTQVSDVIETAQSLASELQWMQSSWFRGNRDTQSDMITLEADRRNNRIIVLGSGESFETIKRIVEMLDQPKPDSAELVAKAFAVENGDLDAIIAAATRALGDPNAARRWWIPVDPTSLQLTADRASRSIIAVGPEGVVERAGRFVAGLDSSLTTPEQGVESVDLSFANAGIVASSINQFFQARARNAGVSQPSVSAFGAWNTSVVILSGPEEELPLAIDIASRLDQPDAAADGRTIEVFALSHADPRDVARAVGQLFPRSRQTGQLPVTASPDVRTGSLVVSAPEDLFGEVTALVERLDRPTGGDDVTLRTFTLETGRASEVASVLRQTFNLDGQGRPLRGPTGEIRRFVDQSGRPVEVSAVITPDERSNAVLVSADEASMRLIAAAISELDDQPESMGVTVRTLAVFSQPATRLAATLERTFAAQAERDGEPLTIMADARTNTLVVTSSKRVFEDVERVTRELDPIAERDGAVENEESASEGESGELPPNVPTPAFGQQLMVIDLDHIAPAEAVTLLERIGVTSPQPLDRPGLVNEPIEAVPLGNRSAIAVVAQPADREAVRNLIETLDSPSARPGQTVKIVPLTTASAANVASAIERLLNPGENDVETAVSQAVSEQIRRLRLRGLTAAEAGAALDLTQPIRIDAEPSSNSLIVASTAANVEAVEALAELLDRLPVGDAVIVRIFHLTNASADQLSSIVQQLFRQGEALRRAPGTNLQGLPTTEVGRALAGEIAVATDERTNALIVAGREEAVALAEVLITQIDATESANWIEPRIVTLEHADAAEIARTIQETIVQGLGDTPDSIGLQRQVGRLRVLQRIGGRSSLDSPDEGGGGSPAGRPAVRALEADIFAPMTRLVVYPEETLNSVILVGATPNLDVIAALIEQLDVEAAARDALVRLYPLQHAAADRIAGLLEQLFRDQVASENLRERDALTVQADTRTNTLIVATSQRSFAIVEKLIDSLDTTDLNPTVGIHVIPVEGADANELAPRIERLMRERLRANAAGQPSARDVVSIQPAESANALIVAASAENLTIIEELVGMLSERSANVSGDNLEIIPLESATADEMVDLLDELYVRQTNRTRGDANAVRVRADSRLNAVVVSGTPADIRSIRDLIESLDGQAVSNVREIKVISLTSANALEMVNLINGIFTGRGGRVTDRQATLLRFANQLVDGSERLTEAEINAAIRAQVSLEPELRTNAVIVTAPPTLMTLIEALIENIDSSAEGARTIEIFKLENADAENMRDLLVELFNLRQQGNLFVLVPAGRRDPTDPNADPNADPEDLTFSTVPDQRQQLSITVDLRTNSLLVSGSEEYLERVSGIIRNLDSQTGTQREQITYELKNARVEEVADALQQFIQIEQDRIARLLGPDRSGSLQRRLEREISVVGVPGSSRLILSASPRYMERVRSLIDELDTPPKQVLIQVLLAEVTLNDEDTFGVDWSFRGAGSRDYGAQSTALGTPLLTSLGVPNLSVSSLDFEVLVRALQVQGRLEVLSRPQILVNDNEAAQIQVGEEIQLVTNVERLDDGRTVSDVTPRDLGVILDVLPSISPDNFVRLDIAPEISALTQRTTQVSSDFEAPVISRRTAETTVTVRDGETIVIGGLIQSSIDLRTSKVPVLGDIPVVGEVFKSRDESTTKTELLIILTPRVIVNPEDIRRYSDIEIDRLSLPGPTKELLRRNDVGLESQLLPNGPIDQNRGPLTNEPLDQDVTERPGRNRQEPSPEEELEGFELPL